jgi:hypothetical protein
MVVKKVALDQIVAAPPFYAGFLIATGAMQQQNWTQIEKRIENDYMDILLNNWKVGKLQELMRFLLILIKLFFSFGLLCSSSTLD